MKKRYGYAIPLCLCVAAVTLFLGLSAAQMTAADLQVASHQYYQERARQVAEFGLQKHLTLATGSTAVYVLGVGHPDDLANVQVFDNQTGAQPLTVAGCPVSIPAGCQYWISSGEAREGTRLLGQAKVGGMVRWGQPLGSAGAQINELVVVGAGSGVDYQTLDGLTGNAVADEFIVSSSAVGPDSLLGAPVKFSEIAGFAGKIRLPQGGSTAAVDYTRALGPLPGSTFSQDGGQINLPPYSPPLNGIRVSSQRISSNQSLPPGHYGTLTLDAGVQVSLAGAYYVESLIVPGSNTRLVVSNNSQAKFFADQIQGEPELENRNSSAMNFRIYVKPAATRVDLAMAGPGGVAVVAPGHPLHVSANAANRIRGSFCCEHLETAYGPGLNPRFIYDISANQSRNSGPRSDINIFADLPVPERTATGASSSYGPMLLSLQIL